MHKITADLIQRARAIAPGIVPIKAYIADREKPNCLCGLGLLLKADGQDPSGFDTNDAMAYFFGVLNESSDMDYTWRSFDQRYRNIQKSKSLQNWMPLRKEDHLPLFNDWLDEMEKVFVHGGPVTPTFVREPFCHPFSSPLRSKRTTS